MSGAISCTDQGTCPATAPPPIKPWNRFDPEREDDWSIAVKLIAEILMDDEWHYKVDVVDELAYEVDMIPKTANKLLGMLKSHGDIRQDGDVIRLTTRWKGWTPDDRR